MEKLNVKLYKVASFEITDHRLIDYIASKKKPIILSTGIASLEEIKQAIKIIEKYHKKIVILHCVSNYPANPMDINLNCMLELEKQFKVPIGFSDHTIGNDVSLTAVAIGASNVLS